MNSNNSPMSWLTIVVLISLLLFKGVAAAAMLCCGPEHSAHSELQSGHSQSPVAEHHRVDHSAMGHTMANHSSVDQDPLAQTSDAPVDLYQHVTAQSQNDEHQSSCSGCAVSCAAAVLLLNSAELLAEQAKAERIFSVTPFVFPWTSTGLERPPRLYS